MPFVGRVFKGALGSIGGTKRVSMINLAGFNQRGRFSATDNKREVASEMAPPLPAMSFRRCREARGRPDCRHWRQLVHESQQAPPVAGRVEHAHDGHAVRARFVEHQVVVEIPDPPFADARRSGCLSVNGAPILGCRASSVKLASALLRKRSAMSSPALSAR